MPYGLHFTFALTYLQKPAATRKGKWDRRRFSRRRLAEVARSALYRLLPRVNKASSTEQNLLLVCIQNNIALTLAPPPPRKKRRGYNINLFRNDKDAPHIFSGIPSVFFCFVKILYHLF